MCGISFSGKTTISKLISQIKGFVRVDLDEVKVEIVGPDLPDEKVTEPEWDQIYQSMYQKVKNALLSGQSVVQDAGNFTRYERGLVRAIVDNLGLEAITIFVDTPPSLARQRLLHNRQHQIRFDVSNELFKATIKELEPPIFPEVFLTINPSIPIEKWIKDNL
jgi:predicted kinase